MIPAGYMAKHVRLRPDWLKAPHVSGVYSVSGCISEDFADYINFWKHNGYWLFNSPAVIKSVAEEHSISLNGTTLLFYEVHAMEFDGAKWSAFRYQESLETHVVSPEATQLLGFDVVTFYCRTSPEHSPLSCNGLAETIPTNEHCLIRSFEEAESGLNNGQFLKSEPGPYRIMSVHSIDWP
jgi:hypothetical protein